MLATMHIGSKALVNNPQAFTELYFDGKVVEKILNKNFPGNNFYDVTEKYPERFSITECFKKHNHIPKTLYVFNGSSYTDYDKQYTHLIKKVTSEDIDLSNIEFLIYHDKKLKHGPLSKDKTVHLINSRLVYDDL
ncbi:hypothetical protein SAMN05216216_1347 [Lacicoccus qingdaonensis]|uniref:Uncharacterized protein n=2 Tax=Lacicoccus qingdaonensis TaxID=576118 RepID=A0A1G9IK15_9BACL|nr:hypothetical protein SAMN05216216_1347 [Salinicoccus qingdaonensis]